MAYLLVTQRDNGKIFRQQTQRCPRDIFANRKVNIKQKRLDTLGLFKPQKNNFQYHLVHKNLRSHNRTFNFGCSKVALPESLKIPENNSEQRQQRSLMDQSILLLFIRVATKILEGF